MVLLTHGAGGGNGSLAGFKGVMSNDEFVVLAPSFRPALIADPGGASLMCVWPRREACTLAAR